MSRGVWIRRVLPFALVLQQVCSGVYGGHHVPRTPLSKANVSYDSILREAEDTAGEHGHLIGSKATPRHGWQVWPSDSPSRQKRAWNLPPIKVNHVIENDPGPYPKFFMMIRSDKEKTIKSMVYGLTGPGVDKPPIGTFTIDAITGKISIMFVLDREKISSFELKGTARDTYGNSVEPDLDLTISVLDENDNSPVFKQMVYQGNVSETTRAGSPILKVEVTDEDDPATNHVQMAFSIASQQPLLPSPQMFTIDRLSGLISTGVTHFDAETVKSYTLLIRAEDCNGAEYSRSSTGTVVIRVEDVNDNAPVFPQQNFMCMVLENTVGETVLVLKTLDGDKPHTPAWRVRYRVVAGQHSDNFDITTNVITNEGILTVRKALDFESTKQVLLIVVVENEEPLWGVQLGPSSTATVTVNVQDQNEPPEFSPDEIAAIVTEEQAPGVTLGTFTARDPDMGQQQQIRYKIGYDPFGWLSIHHVTGEVRTQARLDREAHGVYNSTYIATILAIDNGVPPQTGTASVFLRITDVNDHRPVLNPSHYRVCEDLAWHGINVTVLDGDEAPNAGPFTFSLAEEPPELRRNWRIVNQTGEVLVLVPQADQIHAGHYNVSVLLTDRKGQRSEQVAHVMICFCDGKLTCPAALGGIGLGLVALLIIILCLLIVLLLFLAMLCCLCCCANGCCGYVRSGGGILYVGEHSNIGGVQTYNYEGGGEEDLGTQMNLLGSATQGRNGSGWSEDAKAAYSKSSTLRAGSSQEYAGGVSNGAAAAAEVKTAASVVNKTITVSSTHTSSSTAHEGASKQARATHAGAAGQGAALGGMAVNGSDAWAAGGGGGAAAAGGVVESMVEGSSSSSSTRVIGGGGGVMMGPPANGGFHVPVRSLTLGGTLETDFPRRIVTMNDPWASGQAARTLARDSVSTWRSVTRREERPTAAVPAPVWQQRHTLPKLVGMKQTPDVRKFVAQALEWANNDPTAPPFDGKLIFCYEGQREDDHSFSPCVSVTNLTEEAQFRPIFHSPPSICRSSPHSRAATPPSASRGTQLPRVAGPPSVQLS